MFMQRGGKPSQNSSKIQGSNNLSETKEFFNRNSLKRLFVIFLFFKHLRSVNKQSILFNFASRID